MFLFLRTKKYNVLVWFCLFLCYFFYFVCFCFILGLFYLCPSPNINKLIMYICVSVSGFSLFHHFFILDLEMVPKVLCIFFCFYFSFDSSILVINFFILYFIVCFYEFILFYESIYNIKKNILDCQLSVLILPTITF